MRASRKSRPAITKRSIIMLSIGFVAASAALAIVMVRAADPTANFEAEDVAITGNAAAVTDATASGSRALEFSAASAGGDSYYPPANPNATSEVRNVLNFLKANEGQHILAGQQEEDQCTTCESDRMRSISGKMPAVHGHEIASYATDPVREAINDWTVRRQIPEFTWHVSAPGLSEDWTNVNVDADVNATVTPGTSQYNAMMSKLDGMAARLKTLQDAHVPVLWRPWHEINGGWFWWSSSGAEAAKKLWILEYNYFTTTKGLNNLIWVWSSAENEPPNYSWYPGDQYVDITGTDTYTSNSTMSNWASIFGKHKQNAQGKLTALTESDYIPDPAQLQSQGVKFMWFLPWYGQYVDRNGNAKISQAYTSDYVITADEMPNLTASGGNQSPSTPVTLNGCSAPAATYGSGAIHVTAPISGTYHIWSRVKASGTPAYFLQIDSACPFQVGGTGSATSWTWLNYQDGTTAKTTTAYLQAGTHLFTVSGQAPGVSLDRVVLALEPTCEPAQLGDNCIMTSAGTPQPTSSPTVQPTIAPTSPPTSQASPTPASSMTGDLNHDGKVDLLDLNSLLTGWGTSQGDTTGDTQTDVYDLSTLLTHWAP